MKEMSGLFHEAQQEGKTSYQAHRKASQEMQQHQPVLAIVLAQLQRQMAQ